MVLVVPFGLAQATADPEPQLTAFVWLTGLVISAFLVLARLSERVVDGESAGPRPDTGASASAPADVGSPAPGREQAGAPEHDRPPSHPDSDHPTAAGEARTAADATRETDDTRRAGEGAPGSPPAPAAGGEAADSEVPSTATDADQTLSPGVVLVNVALTQGLFGVVLAGGVVLFGVPAGALGIAPAARSSGPTAVAVGIGLGVGLWIGNEVASGIASAVGADYDEVLRGMLSPTSTRGWIVLLGGVLPIVAVVEEFIFRAAAIGATEAAFGTNPWALAAVSSVAFALGHGAQGRVGIVVTGGLGAALAAAFVLTNSLLVVVIAHYLVNALEFVVHEGLGRPDPIWAPGG